MDKITALIKSRRFWAAVGGAIVIALQDVIGIDEQTANGLVAVVIGWIVGDSLTKTE